MKILNLSLLIILACLQYGLWLGEGNWRDEQIKKKEVSQQILLNNELKSSKDALRAEIIDLQNGTEALRETARNELTYISKGEILYRITK